MPISSRDPSMLPAPAELRRLMQSLAALDAILMPEWQYRYYSFNTHFGPGLEFGSMRNGSGDEFYAVFTEAGCFLKGFAHEYEMSPFGSDPPRLWPGLLDGVPPEFAPCLAEPAYMIDHTTFALWRRHTDAEWGRGPVEYPPGHPDPDGSAWLLAILDGDPQTYLRHAADYFEKPWVTLEMVRHVYDHRLLTDEMVRSMCPDVEVLGGGPPLTLADLLPDLAEIGYPH